MRKLLSLVCTTLFSISLCAQNADIKRVGERNKKHTSVTASVTQTRHNVALTDDAVSKGSFCYDMTSSLSMDFASSKEMLLAVGNEFSMVKNGKKRTVKASANGVNPYKVLSEVFAMVCAGSSDTELKSVADVTYESKSGSCTITATPKPDNSKQKKRAMYSKFVATVSVKSGEVTRVVIYDKNNNFVQYDFSKYSYDAKLDTSAFTSKYAEKK